LLLLLQAQYSPGILVQAIEKVKSLGVAYFTAGKVLLQGLKNNRVWQKP
jgi:hypothetical protein